MDPVISLFLLPSKWQHTLRTPPATPEKATLSSPDQKERGANIPGPNYTPLLRLIAIS